MSDEIDDLIQRLRQLGVDLAAKEASDNEEMCRLRIRIAAQDAALADAREVVRSFDFPTHGNHGGPLVAGKVWYEDGTEKPIAKEDIARARAWLKDHGEGQK